MEAREIPLNTPIRPDERLLKYYFTYSLFWFVLFPVVFLAKYIRYRTLRYVFTDKEITMSWGGIQKQSISVSYERVQDIQLSSGPIERQFALAKVQLQTASGDASAEIVLEGFLNPGEVRDQLYRKIQHAKEPEAGTPPAMPAPPDKTVPPSELVEVLKEVNGELRAIRQLLTSEDKGA